MDNFEEQRTVFLETSYLHNCTSGPPTRLLICHHICAPACITLSCSFVLQFTAFTISCYSPLDSGLDDPECGSQTHTHTHTHTHMRPLSPDCTPLSREILSLSVMPFSIVVTSRHLMRFESMVTSEASNDTPCLPFSLPLASSWTTEYVERIHASDRCNACTTFLEASHPQYRVPGASACCRVVVVVEQVQERVHCQPLTRPPLHLQDARKRLWEEKEGGAG